MRYFLIMIFIVVSCISCDEVNEKDEVIGREQVQFTDLTDSIFFYIFRSGTTILENQEDYIDLWSEDWPFEWFEDTIVPPPIDFENDMLIVIHYGLISSGCDNKVEVIKSVETDGHSIFVTLRDLQPLLGGCDMVVYPYQVIKIEKTLLELVFEGPRP